MAYVLDMPARKSKLGTDLPADVVKTFGDWCKARGIVQSNAAAGAIQLYMWLPLWFREAVMLGQWDRIEGWIDAAAGADLQEGLGAVLLEPDARRERKRRAAGGKADDTT